jgi:ATP-dependent helicase HepA
MSELPRFKRGDSVVLRSTRELGRVERDPVLDGDEYWYRVRFVKRSENVVEADLDPLDDECDSIEQLATLGRWGRIQAFRCALAMERITQTNRSTVYSFKSQRILFEPYQYKPLLKILDSPDRRLLIADEVGLGKTIEAGLIQTELEARRPLDKVLIVCPSRLRDKWREELNRKFDQEFDIYDKQMILRYLERQQNPRRSRLRAIVSMQTLRDEELRERLVAEIDQIDLVIFDEAHHARNPETLVSAMLRDLGQIGDCVVLLTATPLHLGNRDLFTLLQALRPVEFRDAEVFDKELRRHSRIHDAALLVRSRQPESVRQAADLLKRVFLAPGGNATLSDPVALQVIQELDGSFPRDRREWIDLERRVQELHPLATIVTRTRKRDVQEHAAARRAAVFRCRWTPDEDHVYQRLVKGAASLGWIREELSIGEIQRARQAASCLPAAAEARAESFASADDEATELSDILPGEVQKRFAGKSVQQAFLPAWSVPDSKFDQLLEILRLVWAEEPHAKVLIFTFFVGTAKYLERRLNEIAYSALRIAGDVPSNPHRPELDERGKRMRQFREDPAIKVLVSTEVGSEGLDFQYCHHLVNYDLPWNPMVLEQRIGRIDRFGQESDVIHIHNLVVKGTVEDRILYRLYERIGIFRESIGDLENILGETMRELQQDYVSGRLTPEEAEERVEQAAWALDQRRAHLEQLEKSAGELFGHEEYIREEMQRIGRLGRFVSEEAILAVLRSYLESHHPGLDVWSDEPGIYGLRLTDELRYDIQTAAAGGPVWIDRSRDAKLRITMQGEMAFRHPEVELLNVTHPLLKAAIEAIKEQLQDPSARVGQTVVVASTDSDCELEAGMYFIVVFSHTIEGLRARRVLETAAWWHEGQRFLDAESSERLLYLATEQGKEWDRPISGPEMPSDVWDKILSQMRRRNRDLHEREQRENDSLYTRRRRVLDAEYEHHRRMIEQKLRTAELRGRERILPAFRGQLQKAEADYRAKQSQLEQTRIVTARLSEPVAACLVELRRE